MDVVNTGCFLETVTSALRPMKVDGSRPPLQENLVKDFDQLSSFSSKFPNELHISH
jgi:hypothetical protein